MSDNEVMTKEYETEAGVFELRCPKKSTVDAVLKMIDLIARRYRTEVVMRAAHTLRVRMYLKSIEMNDEKYVFHPISDLLDYHGTSREALWEMSRNLQDSLNFASEALFSMLMAASEDFKKSIDQKGKSQIMSMGSDLQQAAKRLVKRKEDMRNE